MLQRYNGLEFTKKDISEHNIASQNGKSLGLKDYYNHVFLEKARNFIKQYDMDEATHVAPIKHHKAGILQKMQMDSPLRMSVYSMSRKSDFAVFFNY